MSDRIFGGILVLVAATMAFAARDYVATFSYEPVGPRAYPMLLALLMGLGGLWLVIKPGKGQPWRGGVPVVPLALAIVAIFAYALLFQQIGFTLATVVMTVPVGMAFGGSWLKSLAGGLILGILLFLLFDKVLDVVLPSGWLAFLFGGR